MYLQARRGPCHPGFGEPRQALGDPRLVPGCWQLSELSRWLGSSASQWGRGLGLGLAGHHRDPVQEQDPGLVDDVGPSSMWSVVSQACLKGP